MIVWKIGILIGIALAAPIVALATCMAWSIATDGMFTLSLGRYGAAFVGRLTFGVNLEDADGGFHGIAIYYFQPAPFGNITFDRVIRTHCPPEQRSAGESYVGAPRS